MATQATPAVAGAKKFGGYLVPAERLIVDEKENARRNITAASVRELADSIFRKGQEVPVSVRLVEGGKLQLVAGYRRVAAIKLLNQENGAKAKPILVKAVLSTAKSTLNAKVANLVENVQRENLTPLETAMAVHALATAHGMTPDVICQETGKKMAWVQMHLKVIEKMEAKERAALAKEGAGISTMAKIADTKPEDRDKVIDAARKSGGITRENVVMAQRSTNAGSQAARKQVSRVPPGQLVKALSEYCEMVLDSESNAGVTRSEVALAKDTKRFLVGGMKAETWFTKVAGRLKAQ